MGRRLGPHDKVENLKPSGQQQGMSDTDLDGDEELIRLPASTEPQEAEAWQSGLGQAELLACSIDRTRLGDEFIELSGHLAFWGDRYADAQVAKMRAELGVKKLKGKIYLQLRASKDKGDTEASLAARVETDQLVQEAEDLALIKTGQALKLKSLIEAIRMKGDMLVSLGAHQRAELKGDPMLRHASREDG